MTDHRLAGSRRVQAPAGGFECNGVFSSVETTELRFVRGGSLLQLRVQSCGLGTTRCYEPREEDLTTWSGIVHRAP